jgi:hypothetical protein
MDFLQNIEPLEFAELVLAQLGPGTLTNLKETLKEEGLNPPSRWNTGEAREFVASIGFPEEFAASPESRRESKQPPSVVKHHRRRAVTPWNDSKPEKSGFSATTRFSVQASTPRRSTCCLSLVLFSVQYATCRCLVVAFAGRRMAVSLDAELLPSWIAPLAHVSSELAADG